MKYLYPYECEKEKLSSPDELQSAIDGNRREGRRSSYGQYPEMVGATPPPSHLSRNQGGLHHTSPLSLVSRSLNGHNSQGMSSGEPSVLCRHSSATAIDSQWQLLQSCSYHVWHNDITLHQWHHFTITYISDNDALPEKW